jgi:hypothetical protein
MKALEFAKGRSRALGLTLAPGSPEAFVEELRTAKVALLDWRDNWGRDCDLVMWTVSIDPEHLEFVEETLRQIYDEETGLAPLLQSVRMQVNLLSQQGKPLKEFTLEPQAISEKRTRPWWKVW